jgi:hypothetical protein
MEGYIGACDDACYRMDLSDEDKEWLQGLNTGQRVQMLIDFFHHVEMGKELSGEWEHKIQEVLNRLEDMLCESVDN